MKRSKIYTTRFGLKCIFVNRPGFKNKYCGIGCHFGSSHTDFSMNGKKYHLKSGIAHFLEHKAFVLEDGMDALMEFDRLNCQANAYTSYEQTIYYFQTNDSIEEPLELLLEMYFTKGFTRENIESEKNIILSELFNSKDDIEKKIHDLCLEMLYPKDSYSMDILGSKEDIKNTTLEDLSIAYSTFYTPRNSLLVVVGDLDILRLEKRIEEKLSTLVLNDATPVRENYLKSIAPSMPKTIELDVPYPEIHIMGRIDSLNYNTYILTNIMIALLDGLFSVEAPFYKELLEMNLLLTDDIEYSVSTLEFGMYYHIEVYTKYPERLLSLILEKLNSFSEKDYYTNISKSTIKLYLCDYIRAMDSISYVGDETLTLGLEGSNYDLEYDWLLNLKDEDLISYIPYIKNALKTSLTILPKNSTKKNKK